MMFSRNPWCGLVDTSGCDISLDCRSGHDEVNDLHGGVLECISRNEILVCYEVPSSWIR